jgi:lipoprotein-anchoring transpeptidase ErfK/SrfK
MAMFNKRRSRYRHRVMIGAVALVTSALGVGIWRYWVGAEVPLPDTPSLAASAGANEISDAPATKPVVKLMAAEASEPASRPAAAVLPANTPTIAAREPVASVPAPAAAPMSRPAVVPPPLPATLTSIATTAPSTAPTASALGTVLTDAQALVTKGDTLGARRILNQAIISGQLPHDQEIAAKKLQAELNQTLVFSYRRASGDEWMESYVVKPGDALKVLGPRHSLTPEFIQRINRINDAKKMRYGMTLKLLKGPFYAVVTKSAFTLDLYLGGPGGEGSLYVMTLPVGLGQDDSTPTGKWEVVQGKKLMHPVYYDPRNQGVMFEGSDPNNPLGGYWIGLNGLDGQAVGKLSYGIHGTIEPDSVGKMSSLGCIRLRTEDVQQVYDMLVEGKSIVVVKP